MNLCVKILVDGVFFVYTVYQGIPLKVLCIFSFHYENIKKSKLPIVFCFCSKFDVFLDVVKMSEKHVEMFFVMWPDDKCVISVSEPYG